MPEFYDTVAEPARRLEAEIGLPAGMLERLQLEDDWSFVVKIHALIEAAVTHAIIGNTGLDVAQAFFSHLELSGSRTGKIVLAEKLELLTSEERRFIRALSELRNFFVHDVANTSVTLTEYFDSLSKDKCKYYAAAFCYVNLQDPDAKIDADEAVRRLRTEPMQAMWSTGIFIVAVLQLQVDAARSKREADKYMRKVAMALDSLNRGKGSPHV